MNPEAHQHLVLCQLTLMIGAVTSESHSGTAVCAVVGSTSAWSTSATNAPVVDAVLRRTISSKNLEMSLVLAFGHQTMNMANVVAGQSTPNPRTYSPILKNSAQLYAVGELADPVQSLCDIRVPFRLHTSAPPKRVI